MDKKLNDAVKKWGLNRCEAIYQYPTKAVFAAESEQFGAVILKINEDTSLLKSEYQMLAGLSGEHSCKVYAYDESAGLLLEERIFPGTVLRKEPSLEKRIRIFTKIFQKIHMPAGEGETYLNWLEQICEYCARNQIAEKLADLAPRARGFCAEMFEKYPDRVLLHGDLHHDNLLLGAGGSYTMIDPKGVIGPAILDLPRFILNELDTEHECPDRQHMGEVIRLIAEQTGYPEADIGKLYFMEVVLANVWCAEDGEEVNWQEIDIASENIGGEKR